jgi:Na+/pantothenate symporter
LTGGRIVDSLRYDHGFGSVQDFLRARFGGWGSGCYNFVIAIRLVSEVFANVLVIGILFGVAGSKPYTLTILFFSAITLFYSMLGELLASLRTDVFQMVIFLGTLVLLVALVISAMSTLDSALSSSAKLVAVDMRIMRMSLRNGRAVMALFMLFGLLLVFWGNKDLISAVAVSGTASLYLAPVIFFSLWGKRRDIPVWSYLFSFVLAIAAAVLYFTEASGYSHLLGDAHKYTKLLYLTVGTLTISCFGFWLGDKTSPRPAPQDRPA